MRQSFWLMALAALTSATAQAQDSTPALQVIPLQRPSGAAAAPVQIGHGHTGDRHRQPDAGRCQRQPDCRGCPVIAPAPAAAPTAAAPRPLSLPAWIRHQQLKPKNPRPSPDQSANPARPTAMARCVST